MHAIKKTAQFAQFWPLLGVAAALQLAACGAAEPDSSAPGEAALAAKIPSCGVGNTLRGELDGSDFSVAFSLGHEAMDCDSMLRPDRDGPRLRFSAPLRLADESVETRLGIILALPGLDAGESDAEVPTNITLQIEGSGRFFSTPNMQSCWSEIDRNEPLAASPNLYQLSGAVFCVAPLGELNSSHFVDVNALAFTATVDWSET